MKYIIFLIAVVFAVGCQNVSSKTEKMSAEQVSESSPISAEDIDTIRKIDFQNFTYPWTKSFGGKEKSFTLKNGISKLADERRISLQTISFTPDEDKALIVIKINDGNAAYQMLYVYELEGGKPKLMESFEFGQNNISFATAFEAHGELVIETYHQLSGDAECCSSIIEISYYKWQKDKFVLQGESQKIPNGYIERSSKKNQKN